MLNYFTLPLLLLLASFGKFAVSRDKLGSRDRRLKGDCRERKRRDGSRFESPERSRLRDERIKAGHLALRSGPKFFFKILVFNNALRGPEPESLGLIRRNSAILPEAP